MIQNKTVVLGVSGGIAAYKALEIVSSLKKLGANVEVIMTKNAQEFVMPLSFETLSENRAILDTFDKEFEYKVGHVSLAKKADIFVVAPATANVIGKFAGGIADDMLSTSYMASKAAKLICPAMNTNMYESQEVQNNIKKLSENGVIFIDAVEGRLACGDIGKGKMAEPSEIVKKIVEILSPKQDFNDKKVLVTAGATSEPIDGVRFITNRSSGKMGVAIANAAAERGAEVTLIAGNMTASIPKGVKTVVKVKTTGEMYDAVMSRLGENDVVIKAAAPADYRLKKQFDNKLKGENITLEFEKNPDIAKAVGLNKNDKVLVVFSAETENLIANATGKLKSKNADIVVANDVTKEGAGFDVDTNICTIIDKNGNVTECPLMAKTEIADVILDTVLKLK